MQTILETIVEQKKKEVALICQDPNWKAVFESKSYFSKPCLSAKAFVLDKNKTGIIAEFKRQSPSKGKINTAESSVEKVVLGYQKGGASVVSVLTDKEFFGGTELDLQTAKEVLQIPVLRKDFIVDPVQVYQTKAMGADLMLLIAECLSKDQVYNLSKLAKEIGLEVLLELHSEDQLEKLSPFIDMVGVNNRNLNTFEVDVEKSKSILKKLPSGMIKIAESGISDPKTVDELSKSGFDGFLIGENFMKTNDPAQSFADFVAQINKS
ncbi:MAG: indole-3-glycerol phosphate synthase TrpC [Flavobacteriaceae bacterium]|nr:MAG: indole-3-glycerol phosphate synthase TrpC [Flavobacteriaceae bacterium]